MSLFLAPIHEMMYKKIHYLESLNRALITLANKKGLSQLGKQAEEQFGLLEEGPLKDNIDQSNIHGWLNERVALVENRLAYLSSKLVENGLKDEVLDCAKAIGASEDFNGTSKEAYIYMTQHFLDGMPCDHVLAPIELEDELTRWKVTKDVHKHFFTFGVDGELYDEIRNAWIEGLLKNTDLIYYQNNNSYTISKQS